MIAAFITVVSVALLLQFSVSYCRSLIATYRKMELSEQVREVTGIASERVDGEEFVRLLHLVDLCPEKGDDQFGIRAVRAYYRALNIFRAVTRAFFPRLAAWVEREREDCSYFAAVTLDRRIAYSRDILAHQMAEHS
ncbi:MAG: hypothetical protein ACRD50_02765 [Candidatus Acidiferrales bacterium]